MKIWFLFFLNMLREFSAVVEGGGGFYGGVLFFFFGARPRNPAFTFPAFDHEPLKPQRLPLVQ